MNTGIKAFSIVGVVLGVALVRASPQASDYPIKAAALTKTHVTSGFWFDRLATNRLVTLKTDFAKCNETPRIANFTNAANHVWGGFKGTPFDDSDVYKVVEGAAYIQAMNPDPERERYVNWLIGQFAAAQETDGYLYTARTMGFTYPESDRNRFPYGMMGPTRWSKLGASHELYNVGHMYEAAVAWYEATGNTNFLSVAEKSANLLCRTFGWEANQLKDTSGHEEIELGLCKLYRATGKQKYLELAKFFIDLRGRRDVRAKLRGPDQQDHQPVVEQGEAIGHAVRAGYLYSGVADVAALTGDAAYNAAIDRLWENVVSCKLHLTGGIGAYRKCEVPGFGELHEAFAGNYDLPNDGAYNETCAAIANALWNQRMFCAKGESKYVDVLERVLYNGFPSGVALAGDEFFYQNPLASKGGYKRSKWFGCSCCPVNDVRFIPQVPSFAYVTDGKGTLYWNLFMAGTVGIHTGRHYVELEQQTGYPWSGKAALKVTAIRSKAASMKFALKVRVPGWAKGRPVPSDLYMQTEPSSVMEIVVAVNGLPVNGVPGEDGYLTVEREWKVGETVEVDFPMPVKRIRAHAKVAQDQGRLAVERGPVVYCAEGCDNGGKAFDATLPADATFADDSVVIGDKTYPALKASNGLKLIPYCLWGNREPGNEMQVWFRER